MESSAGLPSQGQLPATANGRLWACGMAFCAAILMIVIVLVVHLRERAIASAGRELQSLTAVLADQAERAFQAVELVQTGLQERLEQAGVDTADDYRKAMSGRAMHDELRSRVQGLPQVDAITAIDADGALLNFTRYWPIPAVNVADRDYFRALKNDPTATSFISEPVPNRGTGTWTIYIARRISSSTGDFLGLILGAVELAYFERLYGSVAPSQSSSISLFRQDGVLLARYPHVAGSIGRSFASNDAFHQLRLAGPHGTLVRLTSLADGQDRLAAAHQLSRYPLMVNATRTTEAVLAEWRKLAAALLVATFLIVLAVCGNLVAIARHLRGQRLLAEAKTSLALAHERERAEQEARCQAARFRAALDNMPHGLSMFDAEGYLLIVNTRYVELYDLPTSLAKPGTPLRDILLHHVEIGACLEGLEERVAARVPGQDETDPLYEVREIRDGRTIAISRRRMPGGGWVSIHEDVTDRRAAEERIAHMAHHDALTGLPNRILLRERLCDALLRANRGEPCAVLCLDLDRFKEVNDTLGHPAGDALLCAVAERLQAELRDTDTLARLGGDEFAIIQSGAEQPHDATSLARRLVASLAVPFDLDGNEVVIGTSIGIALAPGDGLEADGLLKSADLALYRAKAAGRGCWSFFEPGMDAEMRARRALELDLRRALAQEEFELHYQPVVALRSGVVAAFEALVRWHHPTRGLVSPSEFIPLAEETGLIIPLGAWVLQRACLDATSWPDDLRVAVNLSPVQFSGTGPVRAVVAALTSSGLAPSRLELEITETAMLQDTDAILAVLGELRALGVSIAMDDFGTGYSSLSYLRKFPFDRVKIDRSFIEGLGQCSNSAAIVQAVIGLCNALGMTTTAEGIETNTQLSALAPAENMHVQGYLFSPPRPVTEVPSLCREIAISRQEAAPA